jgi:hypothetical protein
VTAELVQTLRDFGEMPLEGGNTDPLIEVMNSLARQAADEIERLRSILRAILHADERGQGTPYAEAMEAAAKAVGWKQREANDVRLD